MFLVSCDLITDSLVSCETLDDPQGLEEAHTTLQMLRVQLDLWLSGHTLQKNLTKHPVTVLNESTQPDTQKEKDNNHLTASSKLFLTHLLCCYSVYIACLLYLHCCYFTSFEQFLLDFAMQMFSLFVMPIIKHAKLKSKWQERQWLRKTEVSSRHLSLFGQTLNDKLYS